MTAIEIMKLGDILHELSDTSDSVLNVIRVLRGIPGKDHDDDVDALYRVYDEICAEMERLAGGITYEQKAEEKEDETPSK